jgi:hypothetical protein
MIVNTFFVLLFLDRAQNVLYQNWKEVRRTLRFTYSIFKLLLEKNIHAPMWNALSYGFIGLSTVLSK